MCSSDLKKDGKKEVSPDTKGNLMSMEIKVCQKMNIRGDEDLDQSVGTFDLTSVASHI